MSKTPKHLYPAARSRSEPTGRRGVKYESAHKYRAHSHRLRDASPWYWFALGFVIYMLAYIAMYPSIARAASPEAPSTSGRAYGAEGKRKEWVITSHADTRVPTRHGYCTAEVDLTTSVRATLTLIPATKLMPTRALITVEGVNFGPPLPAGDSEGLVSVDDGEPVQVYVHRNSHWSTTFELPSVTEESERLRSEFLLQSAKGTTLSVLAGTRVFKVDLAGSMQAIKELHKCNNEGQRTLNKRRMSEAAPAVTRG